MRLEPHTPVQLKSECPPGEYPPGNLSLSRGEGGGITAWEEVGHQNLSAPPQTGYDKNDRKNPTNKKKYGNHSYLFSTARSSVRSKYVVVEIWKREKKQSQN